jgi:hypothetical protein
MRQWRRRVKRHRRADIVGRVDVIGTKHLILLGHDVFNFRNYNLKLYNIYTQFLSNDIDRRTLTTISISFLLVV